jgi:hypothetical protein
LNIHANAILPWAVEGNRITKVFEGLAEAGGNSIKKSSQRQWLLDPSND